MTHIVLIKVKTSERMLESRVRKKKDMKLLQLGPSLFEALFFNLRVLDFGGKLINLDCFDGPESQDVSALLRQVMRDHDDQRVV